MHRCFVAEVTGPRLDLPPEEAHHLVSVLRAGAGDEVIVFDGRGGEWDARVVAIGRRRAEIELLAPRRPVAEPAIVVTLAAGLLKGDAMNTVVRDATALGVAAIQPVASAHVAVPDRAWRDRSVDRWRRVAISSAKQCGRATVPAIEDVSTWPAVLEAHAESLVVLGVEPAATTRSSTPGEPPTAGRVLLAVGPEGGWTPSELALARDRGARLLTLGPRTLRAEIAPTVALAALWTAWGW